MGSVRGFRSQDIFLRTTYKLIFKRLARLETRVSLQDNSKLLTTIVSNGA